MFGKFTERDLLNSLKYNDLTATAKEDPVKSAKKSVLSREYKKECHIKVTLFCYMEMFN